MTIKLFVFFMTEETGEEHFRKSNHIIQLILYEQLALYGMKVLSHAVVFCYYSFTQSWHSKRDPLNLH